MLDMISGHRERRTDFDTKIGCVLLRDINFFEGTTSLAAPTDFAKNVVQGKTYDLEKLEAGHEMRRALYQLVEPGVYQLVADRIDGPVYGDAGLVTPRVGQRAFQALIMASYGRRCAITGDKIRPVLQAAHIRPVASGGENRLDNGMLLRSDVHTLFDRGYLGLDQRSRLRVSYRLRQEFDNGEEFYRRAGSEVSLPGEARNRPNREFIEWHNDAVFLG